MAKFCTKCGKTLEEGEICTCQQQGQYQNQYQQVPPNGGQYQQYQQVPPNGGQYQNQYQQVPPNGGQYQNQYQQGPQNGGQNMNQQYQQAKAAATNLFSKASTWLISLYKRPVSTARSMIEQAEFSVGMAFIVLQGIFSAFFGLMVAGKFLGELKKYDDDNNNALASMIRSGFSGMDSYERMETIKKMFGLPWIKILLVILLLSVAFSMLLAVLLMVGNGILKNRVSFQGMVAAASVRSAVLLPVTVVAMLLSFVNPAWGISLFFLGSIWGFLLIALAMAGLGSGTAEHLPLVMFVIFLIMTVLVAFAISKGWIWCLPDMIQKYIEQNVSEARKYMDKSMNKSYQLFQFSIPFLML